jgi:hypothetical protein
MKNEEYIYISCGLTAYLEMIVGLSSTPLYIKINILDKLIETYSSYSEPEIKECVKNWKIYKTTIVNENLQEKAF